MSFSVTLLLSRVFLMTLARYMSVVRCELWCGFSDCCFILVFFSAQVRGIKVPGAFRSLCTVPSSVGARCSISNSIVYSQRMCLVLVLVLHVL